MTQSNFQNGGIGILAGAMLYVIGALFFGSTQYIYPGQAMVWFGVGVIGLVVLFGAPVYFWLIRPVASRFGATKHV